MLRTRSPLAHHRSKLPWLLVRLACVKHTASVHPEPGSNSSSEFVLQFLDRNPPFVPPLARPTPGLCPAAALARGSSGVFTLSAAVKVLLRRNGLVARSRPAPSASRPSVVCPATRPAFRLAPSIGLGDKKIAASARRGALQGFRRLGRGLNFGTLPRALTSSRFPRFAPPFLSFCLGCDGLAAANRPLSEQKITLGDSPSAVKCQRLLSARAPLDRCSIV